MRLLNTTTFELEEFFGTNIPPYAIASHLHGKSEVTFQDLLNGNAPMKEGWGKIVGCCAQARNEGWNWAVCFSNLLKPFISLKIFSGDSSIKS
jgi:hypothetical protein